MARRYRLILGVTVIGLCIGYLIQSSWHDEADLNPLRLVQRPTSVQTRDDAALLSGWMEKIRDSWQVGKNHQRVKSAFSDVVTQARRSTVRIFSKGQQVAMGVVVDADGMILTKASEVKDHDKLVCQFSNHRRRTAKLINVLDSHDVAMLRVRARNLVAVDWYLGEPPAVGSLLATPSLGSEPLALGVVSLAPKKVANDGVLGIQLNNSRHGPVIDHVVEDSAADTAGLRDGDVILHVNGERVDNRSELVAIINRELPGNEVRLMVLRGDESMIIVASLGRRTELDLENSDFQSFLGGELSLRRSGFPNVLQHDTFLLPEHCGSPVVDLEGRVVGINIARAERIASYALPARSLVPWIEQIKADDPESSIARSERSP